MIMEVVFERNGRDEYTKGLAEKNSVLCIRRDHVCLNLAKMEMVPSTC